MYPPLRNIFILSFFVIAATAHTPEPPFRCPTYINTVVPSGQALGYGKRDPGDPFLKYTRDVHETLSNCSSIKSLKLRLTTLGCEQSPDLWNFPFEFPHGSHYPSQLETLDLEGYDFEEVTWQEETKVYSYIEETYDRYREWVQSGRAWNWLKWLPVSAARKNMTNLDLWIEAMDFSLLKTLLVRYAPGRKLEAPNMTRLAPHLKSLTSLMVHQFHMKDLILALPPNSLNHLSWLFSEAPWEPVEPVIRHHAGSLTSLEWREPESSMRRRRVMSLAQLAELGSTVPNLNQITIDLNQNGTWPYHHLEALATKFPKLESATVVLEMTSESCRQAETAIWTGSLRERRDSRLNEQGCEGEFAFSQPRLNITGAEDMFEFMLEKNDGGKLGKVVFYAGDLERSPDYGYIVSGPWVMEKRSWTVCRVTEDVSEVGNIPSRDSGGRWMVCEAADSKTAKSLSLANATWETDIDFVKDYERTHQALNFEL